MQLAEVQEHRDRLADAIRVLVAEFEQTTGARVEIRRYVHVMDIDAQGNQLARRVLTPGPTQIEVVLP